MYPTFSLFAVAYGRRAEPLPLALASSRMRGGRREVRREWALGGKGAVMSWRWSASMIARVIFYGGSALVATLFILGADDAAGLTVMFSMLTATFCMFAAFGIMALGRPGTVEVVLMVIPYLFDAFVVFRPVLFSNGG